LTIDGTETTLWSFTAKRKIRLNTFTN
jgi:hypothetical protein